MINTAVEHIANQANEYLRRRFELTEDMVVLSSVVEPDGTPSQNAQNKIAMFLVSVERDSISQRAPVARHDEPGRQPLRNAPLMLNLYLMVAANFSSKNYSEALKVLASVVQFFQAKPMFDRQNSPGLDPEIRQLVLDIENLSVNDQALMWGSLGGRYLPSVVYKIRMVAVDGKAVHGQVAALADVDTSVGT